MRFLFLLLFLLFSVNSFSQYSLDRENVKVDVRHMPSIYYPFSQRSYSVKAKTEKQIKQSMEEEEIASMVKLNQWKLVDGDDAKPTLTIIVNSESLIVEQTEVVRVDHQSKDKNGVVTNNPTFYGKITYKMVMYTQIIDNFTGESRSYNSSKDLKVYKAKETSNYRDAADYIRENKSIIIDKLIRQNIKDFVDYTNSKLASDYTNFPEPETVEFLFMGSKKNPDFATQMQCKQDIKNMCAMLSVTGGIEDAKELAKPILAYLNEINDKYDLSNKKAIKAKHAMIMDIANVYYVLEDFENCVKYAQMLVDYKTAERDGELIIKKCSNLKKMMENNHTNTRHFTIDIESFN